MNRNSIQKFIEGVKIEYKEIISLINNKYDFNENKISRIPKDFLDAIIYYLYGKNINQEDSKTKFSDDNFIYGGFFGVESVNDEYVVLIDLQLYRYISIDKTSLINPVEGDVYFGVLFPYDDIKGIDAVADKGFVKLDILEASLVLDISDNYTEFDPADVFLHDILYERIYKNYSEPLVNLVFADSEYYVVEFGLIAFSNFFVRLNNISQYLAQASIWDSFVDMDLDDFIKNEALNGRFPVEGDIEEFLDIFEFVLNYNSGRKKEYNKLLKEIGKCRDNVLLYNALARKYYPVTSRDFVDYLEYKLGDELDENMELTQILVFKESLYNIDSPSMTRKTRRLTTATKKEMSLEVFGNEDYYKYYPSYMLDYIFSIIRGGGLITEEEEGRFTFNLRSQHVFSISPYTAIANVMTLLLDESVLKDFFRNKELDYTKLKFEIWNNLKNGELEKLKSNKWKKKIGEIFEILGLLEGENDKYTLTKIGELYTKYIAVDNFSSSKSNKVLSIFDYKK